MIWRTDRRIVQRIVGLHLLGAETVELFVLRKEVAFGERTIQATDAVKAIISGHKVIARIGNSLYVARRDVTRHTDQCEILSCHYFRVFGYFSNDDFSGKIFRKAAFIRSLAASKEDTSPSFKQTILFFWHSMVFTILFKESSDIEK